MALEELGYFSEEIKILGVSPADPFRKEAVQKSLAYAELDPPHVTSPATLARANRLATRGWSNALIILRLRTVFS